MNHQAGPGSDGADRTSEPTGTQDAVADGTGPAETSAAHTGAEDPVANGAGVGETDAESTVAERSGAGEAGAAGTSAEAAVPAPSRPDTGEPRVDAALTLLDRLRELPVTEHAAVFEQVHAELTAVLGQLDPDSADADG